MDKPQYQNGLLFQPIGMSDMLKPINCFVAKTIESSHNQDHVQYNQHVKSKKKQQQGYATAEKVQRKYHRSTNNSNRKQKQKQYYWPTDIVHDQSGNTVRQLKTYIQTHKINSYIKLNLKQSNPNQYITNKKQLVQKVLIKKQKTSIITSNQFKYVSIQNQQKNKINKHKDIDKRIKNNQQINKDKYYTIQQKDNQINSQRSKSTARKFIKIQYAQITIGRTMSASSFRDKYDQKFRIDQRNHTAKIKKGSNRIYLETNNISSKQKTLQDKKCKSYKQIPKTPDDNEKKYLTPNTSAHFHTIQSDLRDSPVYQNCRKNSNHSKNEELINQNCNYQIKNDDEIYLNTKQKQFDGYEQQKNKQLQNKSKGRTLNKQIIYK